MPTPNKGYLSVTQNERLRTSVRWLEEPVRSALELKIVESRPEKAPGAIAKNIITANTNVAVVSDLFFRPNLRTRSSTAATSPIKPPREKVTITAAVIIAPAPK